MINSALKTLVYDRDNQLPETSDSQFLSLLDRAIVNVRDELKGFEPDAFEVFTEDQAITSAGVSFPTDFPRDEDPLFYPSGEKEFPMPTDNWYSLEGKWFVPNYSTVNIKYFKDLTRQSSMASALPFVTRKAEEILISELQALIYAAQNENEAIPSYTNALQQSDRVK